MWILKNVLFLSFSKTNNPNQHVYFSYRSIHIFMAESFITWPCIFHMKKLLHVKSCSRLAYAYCKSNLSMFFDKLRAQNFQSRLFDGIILICKGTTMDLIFEKSLSFICKCFQTPFHDGHLVLFRNITYSIPDFISHSKIFHFKVHSVTSTPLIVDNLCVWIP